MVEVEGQLLMSHFTQLAELAVTMGTADTSTSTNTLTPWSPVAASSSGGCVMCWKMDRVGRPLSGLMAHL